MTKVEVRWEPAEIMRMDRAAILTAKSGGIEIYGWWNLLSKIHPDADRGVTLDAINGYITSRVIQFKQRDKK